MSLYIKILLSTQIDLKNDFEIAKQLFEIYNVKIYFRIIKTFDYQEHEKELIDAFINLYGDLPRLNTQRILKEFIIAK